MMRSLVILAAGTVPASASSPPPWNAGDMPYTTHPASTNWNKDHVADGFGLGMGSATGNAVMDNKFLTILFHEFDTNNDESISPAEFKAYLQTPDGATAVACAIGEVTCTAPPLGTEPPRPDSNTLPPTPEGVGPCLPWDTCEFRPECCSLAPTHTYTPGTPSKAPLEISGDPFTSFRGKQTQFYLPLGKEEPLITCDGIELRGEAFGSGIKGDTQQWFKSFGIALAGEDLLHVSVQNMSTMTQISSMGKGSLPAAANARARAAKLLADAAAAMVAEEHPDVSVSQVIETRVSAALQAMHWAESFRGGSYPKAVAGEMSKPLTSLNVTVEGRQIASTGAQNVRRGTRDVFFAITQDSAIHIGAGFSETVSFGSGHVGLELSSALAQKYDGEKAVEKTHIDLRFTQLNVSDCTGALPEIWGVQPMTKLSAAMLVPPKV